MDLRQHFALERTLLAYIRTGLAFIGMGFVVARFGLLVHELRSHGGAPQTSGWGVWFGSALVLIGGLIGPLAARMYTRQLRRLNTAMDLKEEPVHMALALTAVQFVVGGAMAVYLVWTR
jgi:putative membrane protein